MLVRLWSNEWKEILGLASASCLNKIGKLCLTFSSKSNGLAKAWVVSELVLSSSSIGTIGTNVGYNMNGDKYLHSKHLGWNLL